MSVKHFQLGHIIDDLESIVRLFSQGVSEKVQLVQESELLKEHNEFVQVSQSVGSDE